MNIFLIIAGIVIFSVTMKVFLVSNIRKQKSKGWKTGDVLILDEYNISSSLFRESRNTKQTPLLAGWNKHNVFIKIGGVIYNEKWSAIKLNKSDLWRKNYESCKTYMGSNPEFSPIVKLNNTESSSDMVDGQPISTLNETMCQVYLKQALESENYELAELLKKQLEKFR